MNTRIFFSKLYALTLSCLLAACSGSDVDSASIEDERALSDLDEKERRALCDELAPLLGGYGLVCENGAATVAESQDACEASLLYNCAATVGYMRNCAEVASTDPCDPDVYVQDCLEIAFCPEQ